MTPVPTIELQLNTPEAPAIRFGVLETIRGLIQKFLILRPNGAENIMTGLVYEPDDTSLSAILFRDPAEDVIERAIRFRRDNAPFDIPEKASVAAVFALYGLIDFDAGFAIDIDDTVHETGYVSAIVVYPDYGVSMIFLDRMGLVRMAMSTHDLGVEGVFQLDPQALVQMDDLDDALEQFAQRAEPDRFLALGNIDAQSSLNRLMHVFKAPDDMLQLL